jgi:hypothetical protein
MATPLTLNQTRRAVQRYAAELVKDIQDAMRQNDKSLNLYKEISYKVEEIDNTFQTIIIAPKEVYYASEGRRAGRFPPREPILKWIKQRRFQFRDKKGRFMSYEAMSFIIQRRIGQHGTNPRRHAHFLSRFQIKNEFKQELIKHYREDVILNIKEAFFASQGL